MKHRIFLVLAFIMLIGLVWSQDYSVELFDSYGDGWDGGLLTISVNEIEVLTDIFLAEGSGPETFYFVAQFGDTVEFIYTPDEYDYENSYYVYNPDGVVIFSDGIDGQDPVGGVIVIGGDLDEWLTNPFGFPGNDITAITTKHFYDLDDNLCADVFVGTSQGLYKWDGEGEEWSNIEELEGLNITSIINYVYEVYTHIIVGTTQGVYVYNDEQNEWSLEALEDLHITSLVNYEAEDYTHIIVGTTQGVYVYNAEDSEWSLDALEDLHITSLLIYYDEDGDYTHIIVGTTQGVYLYNEEEDGWGYEALEGLHITSLLNYYDEDGDYTHIIVGTTQGVYVYNEEDDEWGFEALEDLHITSLASESYEKVIIGTSQGLYVYTAETEEWTFEYFESHYITSISLEYYEEDDDLDPNVWIGTTTNLYLWLEEVSNSESTIIPAKSNLQPNYPNPFNPSTSISFSVESIKGAELKIYNIQGQLVKTCGSFAKGNHSVKWFGKDNQNKPVSSGVYFYKLSSGSSKETRKMLLLK
ncbi:MAG: T9SS type A sorting domain-containing protein [Candidatus Cloacimonetes bacterium]|nr:T9SS type A sorting domain-containing protein [Candidatus Cloacimonadota bacterium]